MRPHAFRHLQKGAHRSAPVLGRDFALVALGGALGALLRFSISTAWPRIVWPWGTLAVNMAGSFILGAVFLDHGMEHSWRLFFAVGLLGSFTTLSTFSVETVELWREGHPRLATLYAALNGVAGPLLALAGWRVAAWLS